MMRLTRVLLAFGLCNVLAALGTLAFAGNGIGLEKGFELLLAGVQALVARGLWQLVGYAGAGCASVAVLAGAAVWLVPWGRGTGEVFGGYAGNTKLSELTAEVRRRVERCLQGGEPSVVQAFDEILRGAVSCGASDVHFSPTSDTYRVTIRVSGTLYEVVELETMWAQRFAIRVKVLARLETHVMRKPQDGRLVTQVDGAKVEARVSTLPTEAGERVVLRLVRGSLGVPNIAGLGFSEHTLAGLRELLSKPEGILFVTGPVGSGKTTTLYSSLQYVAASRGKTANVVTLEDPVEIQLPFATQTQMHERSGRTFANTLRSVLRQDPNVLMVGEIRDHETAEIAVQAGLTGHLILTTLHADSAAGPFARLIDMDVEPFAVASATVGCLSQRLVRTLCTACREPSAPSKEHCDKLKARGIPIASSDFFHSPGCEYCEGEGFAGRAPLAELLIMNAELRQAVIACKTTNEITEVAQQYGMISLLSEGLAMAARGETSLAEVLRVAG